MPGRDPYYAAATVALVDALIALGPHAGAITLIGAQAVYLRVGDADIPVAPTTTDADLAFNPEILGTGPALETLMRAAGFDLRRNGSSVMPGLWEKRLETGFLARVDLLVPAAMSPGSRRRAAPMEGHEDKAAMRVKGIEGAIVDADVMSVVDDAGRECHIRVAGVGALLVAKLHKIRERTESSARIMDKDALDVARLLRTSTPDLARRIQTVLADERSRNAGAEALEGMFDLFGRPNGGGVQMAIRATEGLVQPDDMRNSLNVLTADLLAALGRN